MINNRRTIPLVFLPLCAGFSCPRTLLRNNFLHVGDTGRHFGFAPLKAVESEEATKELNFDDKEESRTLSAASLGNDTVEINAEKTDDDSRKSTAKTNTVNERLMAELQAATEAENGPKTAWGKQLKDNFKYSDKTDEEREAALEAARDLNGVNPIVTILASFFAFGMAFAFWSATQFLGDLFLSHPVSPDAPYTFTRMATVFRNVVMGLSSLASGFSAVSGLGVFLLGVRVAYGKELAKKYQLFVLF